jgi:hypothetical protein
MSKFVRLLVITVALMGMAHTSSAAFLEGEIGFGGVFTPTGGTGGLEDATGIQIFSSIVIGATQDFLPTLGNSVNWQPLVFDPPDLPVTPLWEVLAGASSYRFDLESVQVDMQDADVLNLSGGGTLYATGFDPTPGTWSFSTQSTNHSFFVFSSNSTAQQVGEPTLLALLGTGAFAFGVARRRRRA